MKRGAGIGNLGRAPVPEWEEVARAAWPGRLPANLTAAAATVFLPILLAGSLAGLAAVWAGWLWLGVAAWLCSALADWLATPADHPTTRLLDVAGLRPPLRALLRTLPLLALLALTVPAPAAAGYLTAVLAVQLAWLSQTALATWLWRSTPPLAYRPGAARQPMAFAAHAACYARAVGTPGVFVGLELLALGGAVAAGAGMAPAVALAAAGVAVLGSLAHLAWTVLAALRLRRRQARLAEELAAELDAALPSYLVYVSLAARQAQYIVNQWLPALDALSRTGVVLVREANQLAPLAPTRLAVVYAPSTRNVELVTRPSVRVAFYLAYGERNATLLREPRLRHVMLAHGDSDKATSASALIRAFDETWVAGQAAVDRFTAAGVQLGPERFALIGRPQVAGLPVGPTGREPRVVLYAPTFEGYFAQTTHTSLDTMGPELVRRLLTGHPELRVWFRPHPASGAVRPSMLAAIARIEAMLREAGEGHVAATGAGLTLTDCLAAADLLVSDVSSVTSDFLFTERPIAVCDPDGRPPAEFVAAYPAQAGSYLLGPDLAELDDVLAEAFGEDPLREQRLALKRHVLGDPPGGPQAAFAAQLERLCRDA